MTSLERLRLLLEVETRLWEAVDQALVQAELPRLAEIEVLDAADEPRTRVGGIAARLGANPGRVSKLVDKLADSNLANRTRSAEDGRATVVGTTRLGRATVKIGRERIDDNVRVLWPDDDSLVRALTTIVSRRYAEEDASMTTAPGEGLRRLRLLVDVETRLWKGLEDLLAEAGLPRLGSVETMNVIASGKGVRPLDVATALVITPGAATKIIERLARAEMVERVHSEEDRRSHTLRLTRRGKRALTESSRLIDEFLSDTWPSDSDLDAVLTRFRARLVRA